MSDTTYSRRCWFTFPSTVQVEHKGKHYAFCCAECKPAFDKDPDKYAKSN